MKIIPEKIDGWNVDTLNELVKLVDIESETFDFKKEPNQLPIHLCAMANTSGGFLVLGIEEITNNDGKIIEFKKVGFDNGKQDFILLQVRNSIVNIEPNPTVEHNHILDKEQNKF